MLSSAPPPPLWQKIRGQKRVAEALDCLRRYDITVVGMKEDNHFRTLVFLVMHERSGGKIYSNFANATASPSTCVMP